MERINTCKGVILALQLVKPYEGYGPPLCDMPSISPPSTTSMLYSLSVSTSTYEMQAAERHGPPGRLW